MKKKQNSDQMPPAEQVGAAEEAQEQKPMSLEEERDDLLARLQRVSADYVNYQKRVQRERQDERVLAQGEVIKALLSVLDDMEHALAAVSDADEDDPFYRGLKMVHDKMLQALATFGCKEIEAEGQPLDPERHAAMMQQPSQECDPNTVLSVVQRGYEFNGRVLRPAGVVVAVEPLAETDEECQEE